MTIIGTARPLQRGDQYYDLAESTAYELGMAGYGIVTGGGPGVMEAANRGAQRAGAPSAGLNLILPSEQGSNAFVDPQRNVFLHSFYSRLKGLLKDTRGLGVLPGSQGTLDEVTRAFTEFGTRKSPAAPVAFVGTTFWAGLETWMEHGKEEGIPARPRHLLTDDPREAAAYIRQEDERLSELRRRQETLRKSQCAAVGIVRASPQLSQKQGDQQSRHHKGPDRPWQPTIVQRGRAQARQHRADRETARYREWMMTGGRTVERGLGPER
ncbi:LOG family protein [Yinghuangia aomiensis]|uniref:LOG family protein n=1 Tax=Yinghuangia aomiensis TaxID=676205 RepID=UPI0031E97B6D